MTATEGAAAPPALSEAGQVVDKVIEYMAEQNIDQMAIASALLGGALGVLARSMGDEAMIGVLNNAIAAIRSGQFQRPEG